MNHLNSVIIEGLGYNDKRGESITVKVHRFKPGTYGVETTEVTVLVVALSESAAEATMQLTDGQNVRATGRLIMHNGALAVGSDYIELRRMRKPEQAELVEAS